MKQVSDSKIKLVLYLLFLTFAAWVFYSLAGFVAREYLLDKSKPFASWTYKSPFKLINVWTSWDSGFYYDIALRGYPKITQDVKTAYIKVPSKKWVVVYMGGGVVGEKRFVLPVSSGDRLVNNVVLLIGDYEKDHFVPIYNAYEGIPYCLFEGPVEYERDILPLRNSLFEPTACGSAPCDETYITYYLAGAKEVVFQEVFASREESFSKKVLGEVRPSGFVNEPFVGLGCDFIKKENIVLAKSLDFKNQFTSYSFGFIYPYAAKYLSGVFKDIVVSGLVLSFVFTFFMLLVFYKLLSELKLVENAKWGVLTFAFLPFAFYNFAFLPVSLFNLLYLLSLYLVLRKPFLAVFTLPVLCLVNWYGFVIVFSLWVLLGWLNKGKRLLNFLVLCLAALFGVFLNAYVVYKSTQSLFGFYLSKAPWWGGDSPLVGLVNYFGNFSMYKFFEVFVFSVVLLVLVWSVKRLSSIVNIGSLFLSFGLQIFILFVINGGFNGLFKYFVIFALPIVYFVLLLPQRLKVLACLLFMFFGGLLMALWTVSSMFVM